MTAKTHNYDHHIITITDDLIKEYAKKYITMRSHILSQEDIENSNYFKSFGFDTSELEKIIRKSTIPLRTSTQPYRDIYRSDLGELLLTLYFDEDELDYGESFLIPLKNIWDRELNDLPGRGFDLNGYKINSDGRIQILLGEAKTSEQLKNPPDVVDRNSDSIYQSHVKHRTDIAYVKRRLSNYCKKLSSEHAVIFSVVLCSIESNQDYHDIVYGCCLVRDTTCADSSKDFGKMKSEEKDFEPGVISFAIPTFDIPLMEVVDRFHKAVQTQVEASNA